MAIAILQTYPFYCNEGLAEFQCANLSTN